MDNAAFADPLPKIEGRLLRLRDQALTKPNAMLVQALLTARMERGEPFTSFRALVKDLRQQLPGASLSMVRTAFKRSPALDAWKQAALRRTRRKAKFVSLTDAHLDSIGAPQPTSIRNDWDDDDALWARLLAEATPEERARLNAMGDGNRTELIRMRKDQLAEDRADRRKAQRRD